MLCETLRVLLVNPPIYDFTAYDFWLKPYGLLQVAGFLRGCADLILFDYLDRNHHSLADRDELKSDQWGRGKLPRIKIEKPNVFSSIPRYFSRFGLSRDIFQKYLINNKPFDFAFVQTVMTYWYPGVKEVIEDLRSFCPNTKIVLGGTYATVCNDHAARLGADFIVKGSNMSELWKFMDISPSGSIPYWEGYEKLDSGIIKLTEGCPFKCTYCMVPKTTEKYTSRPIEKCIKELETLVERGVNNIAFYDDALLYQPWKVFIPFIKHVIEEGIKINFHTPNALHARLITPEVAELMVRAGFKTFYIGFESSCDSWQHKTGAKVFSNELQDAVKCLVSNDLKPESITAYQILGHPRDDLQKIEESMRFVNSLGIRVMLSDFSPIPGTPDGEYCRKWIDLDEPLMHNKTAFPIILLGDERINSLKSLCKTLNKTL